MPCGGCIKRKQNFVRKTQEQKRGEIQKRKQIEFLSRKYYDPDKDANYKLTKMRDQSLTKKQLRIKRRIERLQARAFKQAKKEYEQKK